MRREQQLLLALAQIGHVLRHQQQALARRAAFRDVGGERLDAGAVLAHAALAVDEAQRHFARLAGRGGAQHRHARLVGIVGMDAAQGVAADLEVGGIEHALVGRAGVQPARVVVHHPDEVGDALGDEAVALLARAHLVAGTHDAPVLAVHHGADPAGVGEHAGEAQRSHQVPGPRRVGEVAGRHVERGARGAAAQREQGALEAAVHRGVQHRAGEQRVGDPGREA